MLPFAAQGGRWKQWWPPSTRPPRHGPESSNNSLLTNLQESSSRMPQNRPWGIPFRATWKKLQQGNSRPSRFRRRYRHGRTWSGIFGFCLSRHRLPGWWWHYRLRYWNSKPTRNENFGWSNWRTNLRKYEKRSWRACWNSGGIIHNIAGYYHHIISMDRKAPAQSTIEYIWS